MRTLALLLAFLAVSVTAGPIEPRQLGNLGGLLGSFGSLGSLTGNLVPAKKAFKVETLTPTIPGDDVKRVKMTYGPFKLRAANSTKKEENSISLDPQGTGWGYLASDFPTNITVLGARMSIVFEDGEEISNAKGVYNHHAFFVDISRGFRSNIQCGGNSKAIPAINSIMGSAADAGSTAARLNITTRPVTANFIDKDHRVLLSGDLVNYNNETKEVYMVSDVQYADGKVQGLMDTTVHLISVGTCEGKSQLGGIFVRPPKDQKKFTLKGGGLEIKDDGKLMLLRGHMHDGGVNMVFRLNGQEVCDSQAEYKAGSVGAHGHAEEGMGGMLSNMSGCLKQIDVKKGDKISMEANYDMEKHPGREHPGGGTAEAMALFVVVFGKQLQ